MSEPYVKSEYFKVRKEKKHKKCEHEKEQGFCLQQLASDLSQNSSLLEHSTQTLSSTLANATRQELIPASQLIRTAAILAVIGLSETSPVDR